MSEAASTQRNWLAFLIKQGGAALGQEVTVTDEGYDFTSGCAELVYERNGRRFEVKITEMPHGVR